MATGRRIDIAKKGDVDIEIKGVDELVAKLKRLKADVGRRRIVKMIREAADIFVEEMSKKAPVDPSSDVHLKDNIIRRVVDKRVDTAKAHIGPAGGDATGARDVFYGMFQELGTKFFPAQPFIRPAFDAKKDDIEKKISIDLRKLIAKHQR